MRSPVPFGKYLLLDRISSGGMAEVFKAKAFGVHGFEKVVAIKRILPSLCQDEEFVGMFADEAKTAGQLSHANIAQIYELGQVDDVHFICMEYIWGRDLLQVHKRFSKMDARMPPDMAAYIAMRVAEALDYAHRKRDVLGAPMEIVHRDCSPQNVVISYEGEVKLIDFGIARAASHSSRTQAGALKGKYAYMSPEQARGLPVDRRSDIFAVGAVLFESLTGRRLFDGSDFAILEKVRAAEVDSRRLDESGVPGALQECILKCLRRDVDERYQWASELRSDLLGYLQSENKAYSNRTLGEEIREMFAEELQQDAKLLDLYERIDEHGELGGEQPANEVMVSSKRSPRVSGEVEFKSDFDEGATEVFGNDGVRRFLDRIKTDAAADSGAEPKVVFDDGVQPYGVEKLAPAMDTPSSRSHRMGQQTMTAEIPRAETLGPSSEPARKGSWSDLKTAAVVALVTVFLVAGARYLFFGDAEKAATTVERTAEILVVMEKGNGVLHIDGAERGPIEEFGTVTVPDLVAREYGVEVRNGKFVLCSGKVLAKPKEVVVFACKPDLSEFMLRIEGLRSGDTVVVDGRTRSIERDGTFVLNAERSHSIAVSRGETLIDTFHTEAGQVGELRHVLSSVGDVDAGVEAEPDTDAP